MIVTRKENVEKHNIGLLIIYLIKYHEENSQKLLNNPQELQLYKMFLSRA